MFSDQEYYYAWLFYLLGVSFCFGCWWLITRPIPWAEVRNILRLLLVVLLVTPWYTQGASGYLSPAIVVTMIEGIFDESGDFARAGVPLLVSLIIAVTLSLAFYVGRAWWRRRHPVNVTENAPRQP